MVCLDTSFVIDILRGREEARSLMNHFEDDNITITTPTIMELIAGAKKGNVDDRNQIIQMISSLRVLPLGEDEAILAGEIESTLEQNGEMIDSEDIMIGAIASHNNEILITRNKKHFEKIPNLEIKNY